MQQSDGGGLLCGSRRTPGVGLREVREREKRESKSKGDERERMGLPLRNFWKS